MIQPFKLCQVIVLALILLVSTTSAGRIIRLHRSVEEALLPQQQQTTSTTAKTTTATATTTTTTDITIVKEETKCQENTPCGWAVYTPFTRKVDYFMKNTCVCPTDNNTVCLKTDDDLSVSAFVYRCRQLNNSADTNSS